jgi:hypothetical protein
LRLKKTPWGFTSNFGEVDDDMVELLTGVLQLGMTSSFFFSFLFLPLLPSSSSPFVLPSLLLSFL